MRKIMDGLLALQKLQFDDCLRTPAKKLQVEKLRAEVPPPILAHYDRLTARGKKGLALARDGVCSECHLRITSAKVIGLTTAADVQLCDNCGRYLYLPEPPAVELPKVDLPPPPAVKRTSRKVARRVA